MRIVSDLPCCSALPALAHDGRPSRNSTNGSTGSHPAGGYAVLFRGRLCGPAMSIGKSKDGHYRVRPRGPMDRRSRTTAVVTEPKPRRQNNGVADAVLTAKPLSGAFMPGSMA